MLIYQSWHQRLCHCHLPTLLNGIVLGNFLTPPTQCILLIVSSTNSDVINVASITIVYNLFLMVFLLLYSESNTLTHLILYSGNVHGVYLPAVCCGMKPNIKPFTHYQTFFQFLLSREVQEWASIGYKFADTYQDKNTLRTNSENTLRTHLENARRKPR